MTQLLTDRLRTDTYTPPGIDPAAAETVLLFANELASPLYGPDGEPGNFATHTQLVADNSGPLPVCRHERLGSADTAYNRSNARALRPELRQNSIRLQAEAVLDTLHGAYPNVRRIIGVGHSAGAAEIIDMTKAIGEHGLLTRAGLGSAALSAIVAVDYPRYRNTVAGGLLRYGLYGIYERMLSTPPKTAGEHGVTPGGAERVRTDARYNIAAWVQGVQPNIEWIAANMPGTALYAFPAAHSPNNIIHTPGQLRRYVAHMNSLRDDAAAAPCRAEVYDGPHAGGSRHRVILQLLEKAGVVA